MYQLKAWLSDRAGSWAARCFPSIARRIAAGDLRESDGRLGRLILRTLTRRAARAGDWETLRAGLATYWRGPDGDRFYAQFPERFEQWFLGPHQPWVRALERAVGEGPFTRLIEIGCGDGRVLHHLAQRMPALETLMGLDLNASIVTRNRAAYAGQPRLQFETADARIWLPDHTQPGTAVVTYGGVLEYFAPSDLERLFAETARRDAPALWALVEPLAEDFDARAAVSSRAGGLESSFSHPYRRLLEATGWRVVFDEEARIEHRWQMLIARTTAG